MTPVTPALAYDIYETVAHILVLFVCFSVHILVYY